MLKQEAMCQVDLSVTPHQAWEGQLLGTYLLLHVLLLCSYGSGVPFFPGDLSGVILSEGSFAISVFSSSPFQGG